MLEIQPSLDTQPVGTIDGNGKVQLDEETLASLDEHIRSVIAENTPQPPVPPFPQIGVNVGPDGMAVTIMLAPGMAMQQTLNPQVMNQVVIKWLELHPQLLQELAKAAMAAKRAEHQQMALLRDIKRSRND